MQHMRLLSICIGSIIAENDCMYKNEYPPYGRPNSGTVSFISDIL